MVMIGFFAEVAVGYTPYDEDHVHMPTVKSELERTKKDSHQSHAGLDTFHRLPIMQPAFGAGGGLSQYEQSVEN